MFTRATQCGRGVLDPPVSVFSLSLHRHPFLYTLFNSRFTLIINNRLWEVIISEFMRLLFLPDHRETDRFFTPSGVQIAQHDRGLFHFHRVVSRQQFSVLTLTLKENLSLQEHTLTHHTRKYVVY
jgi:hypothetical protein